MSRRNRIVVGVLVVLAIATMGGVFWASAARADRTRRAGLLARSGRALAGIGKAEKGLSRVLEALTLVPDLFEGHVARGRILLSLDRPAEARESFDRALTLGRSTDALLGRAEAYLHLGDLDRSLYDVDAALALKGDLAHAHLLQARILLRRGNPDAALEAAERALDQDATLREAHLVRGDAHRLLGHAEEASHAYGQARDLLLLASPEPEGLDSPDLPAYVLIEVEIGRQGAFLRGLAERLHEGDLADLAIFFASNDAMGLSTAIREVGEAGVVNWRPARPEGNLTSDLQAYLGEFQTIRSLGLKVKTLKLRDGADAAWSNPCSSCRAGAGKPCFCTARGPAAFDLGLALTVNGKTRDGVSREDHLKLEGKVSRGGPRRYQLSDLRLVEGDTVTASRPLFSNVTRAAGLHVDVMLPAEFHSRRQGMPPRAGPDTPPLPPEAQPQKPALTVATDPADAKPPDGGGVAIADYDGDGDLDLYVALPYAENLLFRNRGDGTFEKATVDAGVFGFYVNNVGALWFDYDGDGWLDLFSSVSDGPCHLYRNEGDGTFTDRTMQAGLLQTSSCYSAAAADYDRDGDLDLAVARYQPNMDAMADDYVLAENGAVNLFYRNNGDGTFQEVAASIGLTATRWSFALAFGDADDDGWPDLYVANDYGKNNLYHNQRDGTFRDEAEQAGADDVGSGMGVDWADLDGDGRLDIYISNMYSTAGNRVLRSGSFEASPDYLALLLKAARGNTFLVNRGDGTFRDATSETHTSYGGWAWGCCLFDPDNDGDQDIYVVNGNYTLPVVDDL